MPASGKAYDASRKHDNEAPTKARNRGAGLSQCASVVGSSAVEPFARHDAKSVGSGRLAERMPRIRRQTAGHDDAKRIRFAWTVIQRSDVAQHALRTTAGSKHIDVKVQRTTPVQNARRIRARDLPTDIRGREIEQRTVRGIQHCARCIEIISDGVTIGDEEP